MTNERTPPRVPDSPLAGFAPAGAAADPTTIPGPLRVSRPAGNATLLASLSTASDATRGLTIAADARLDDRGALARLLGVAPELSDVELILRLHARFGDAASERLLGAFAYAVWDHRRRSLTLVRDSLGLRSLHYAHTGEQVAFATYPEAVLELAGLPPVPDPEALAARAARHHSTSRERSLFAGVAKLPPGHTVCFGPGSKPERSRYWRPESLPQLELPGPLDYAGALREVITTAVGDAVRNETNIGAHASGGIDSTSVAVIAQHELQARGASLQAVFSWAPPPDSQPLARDDERRRVIAVGDTLGVPVAFAETHAQDRETLSAWRDALIPTETLLRELAVQRAATARGITVLLSGWGGDELASFNGRGHLAALARTRRWTAIASHLRLSARRNPPGRRARARHATHELRRDLAALLPASLQRGGRLPLGSLDGADPARAAELHRQARAQSPLRVGARPTQLALLDAGHLTSRIEAWQRAGALCGIEYRYPLLDRRVIDFCLAVPGRLWLHDGFTRWIYRAAMDPLLSPELTWGVPKHEPALARSLRDQR